MKLKHLFLRYLPFQTNKCLLVFVLVLSTGLASCGGGQHQEKKDRMSIDSASVSTEGRKPVIYQLLVRLFGNKVTHNKYYGSAEENGCGKFADINAKALSELKDLGISHVWYTGVIEHATMADYSKEGIKVDDPDVVKGRAGSPYAVKDYYDVDPDLAVDVRNRMSEFEALLKRTHASGLKALIDFIPNHVARTYYSDVAPAGTRSFGVDDDKTHAFLPRNDFYYLPGKAFVVPKGVDAGGVSFRNQRLCRHQTESAHALWRLLSAHPCRPPGFSFPGQRAAHHAGR